MKMKFNGCRTLFEYSYGEGEKMMCECGEFLACPVEQVFCDSCRTEIARLTIEKQREYRKTYREKHKDEIKQKRKESFEKNKAKRLEGQRRYNARLKEKLKLDPERKKKVDKQRAETAKKWRLANPEKWSNVTRKGWKKWIENHPEDYKELLKKRRVNQVTKGRTSAAVKHLSGELEIYRERVLELISDERTWSWKTRGETLVWGAYLYILIEDGGFNYREACYRLPKEALPKDGVGKYRRFLRIWRKLKKLNPK